MSPDFGFTKQEQQMSQPPVTTGSSTTGYSQHISPTASPFTTGYEQWYTSGHLQQAQAPLPLQQSSVWHNGIQQQQVSFTVRGD